MDRRSFLRRSAASLAGASASIQCARTQPDQVSRPNIVFVFADQLRSQALGCYGGQQAATPHIDRLASDGVRFTNALSTCPVCSPYRAMMLTGRHPMANGTFANDIAVRDGLPTIATVCQSHGYRTGYIGKWHLEWHRDPFVPPERRFGFQYWAVRNCAHDYFDSFYCGDTPRRIPLPGYEPFAQTELAERFIEEHRHEPFCLFVSWGPPHDPYIAPEEYMRRFPASSIRLRENVADRGIVDELLATDPSQLNPDQAVRRRNLREVANTDAALREWLRGYYAATVTLDDCIGRLTAALDRAGVGEDTIFVFTSDHGDMLGSHRMLSKQMPQEESISIPLIVRHTRAIPPETVSHELVTPIDIMPTLLALAGLRCPEPIDGLDMAEAARGRRDDHRDAALIMKLLPGGNPWLANGCRPWRGVRTRTHTYVHLLDRGPWLLYDNVADPFQRRNLIDDPAHAELRGTLAKRMRELLVEARDPFDTSTIATQHAERRRRETV